MSNSQSSKTESALFWDRTSRSPLKFNRRLPPVFTQVSCSAYSIMKLEAIYSSETSIDFERTTRRYIPEDMTLHNHRCENLQPSIKDTNSERSKYGIFVYLL
jgi:hypothetical protein